MEKKKIAVMGGGPVDSQMGVDYITVRGLEGHIYPATGNGRDLNNFQLLPLEKRIAHVKAIIQKAKVDGMDALMVYCNALNSLVDVVEVARSLDFPAVSPLMIYQEYAIQWHNLGIMSGNCAGLSGVENTLLKANPNLIISGVGVQPVVLAIEDRVPPQECVKKFGLRYTVDFFQASNCEAIVLGCTHLPYLMEALQPYSNIPILNPSDRMYQKLVDLF